MQPTLKRVDPAVRSGLAALRPGIEEFDGWTKLQRLETLYCVGVVSSPDGSVTEKTMICQRPKPSSIVFFDDDQDQSIESFVQGLQLDACTRADCASGAEEHTRSWIHAGKKVGVKIGRGQAEGDGLDVWVKCGECGIESLPRRMSEVAR